MLIWLIPALPLLGVLINGFFGHRLGKIPGWLASGLVLVSFLVAVLVMWPIVQHVAGGAGYADFTLYQWINQDQALSFHAPALQVPVAVRADPLSLTMVLVVTGVGFLIHLYSIGYMEHDERYARYFTFLNLFTFAMLILVMANNYLLMFVGWEGVGLCSYLLIGFWFEKPSAAFAGKKAFLVNRVGDFGFILGLLLIFATFGTLTYSTPAGSGVFDQVAADPARFHAGSALLMWITLLLFVGAMGKSAQGPLYLWLPDAMEGPTPVSALIHAATMVTAGVYMVARSNALFSRAPVSEVVVATVGVVTALFAAIVAIYQYDIKRVLAYSTISQLGFMFIGVGVGAYAAGIFHLVTHAFFKALLFLGAGSVMHALSGELDMRKMGGLRKVMPITWITFLVGWLAIDGIWPFSGFYSKDEILHTAIEQYPAIGWLGLFAALLTAYYMSRLYFTTFEGRMRYDPHAAAAQADASEHEPAASKDEHGHPSGSHSHGHGSVAHAPHESPPVMTIPLCVLGLLALVGGFVLSGHAWIGGEMPFADFLTPSFKWAYPATESHAGGLSAPTMGVVSLIVAIIGIMWAYPYFRSGAFARGWRPNWWVRAADARFGYDWFVHFLFVDVGEVFANLTSAIVDQIIIDGAVNGVAKIVGWGSRQMRQIQTGFVRNYALVILTGAVFVVICLIWLLPRR